MGSRFDGRGVIEGKRRLALLGGRLPHALGAHDGNRRYTKRRGDDHDEDDDSHASPGGHAVNRRGEDARPPLSTEDYFSVKTNIAAPAGKSSTSGHSAG